MNSLQESSYLAGLLEGEGTFTARDARARKQLRVKLEMTDLDVVERATQIMAAGKICKRDRLNRANSQAVYEVCWTSQKAENLMRRILPYMGQRRKAKIEECLSEPSLSHHSRLAPT